MSFLDSFLQGARNSFSSVSAEGSRAPTIDYGAEVREKDVGEKDSSVSRNFAGFSSVVSGSSRRSPSSLSSRSPTSVRSNSEQAEQSDRGSRSAGRSPPAAALAVEPGTVDVERGPVEPVAVEPDEPTWPETGWSPEGEPPPPTSTSWLPWNNNPDPKVKEPTPAPHDDEIQNLLHRERYRALTYFCPEEYSNVCYESILPGGGHNFVSHGLSELQAVATLPLRTRSFAQLAAEARGTSGDLSGLRPEALRVSDFAPSSLYTTKFVDPLNVGLTPESYHLSYYAPPGSRGGKFGGAGLDVLESLRRNEAALEGLGQVAKRDAAVGTAENQLPSWNKNAPKTGAPAVPSEPTNVYSRINSDGRRPVLIDKASLHDPHILEALADWELHGRQLLLEAERMEASMPTRPVFVLGSDAHVSFLLECAGAADVDTHYLPVANALASSSTTSMWSG